MTQTRTESPAHNTFLSAWGLFAALLLIMMGNGLIGVLIGVRSELEGFTTTTTGFIMAAYFGGFLAGSRLTPTIMARVGHIRVFAGLSSLVATAALIHAVWVAPFAWIGLRLVFGFAMAGLYVVVESWLNDAVTNENRGRVMALYMVFAMGGLAAGQIGLVFGSPLGQTLFLVAGALMALAIAPVSLSINTAPAFEPPPSMRSREIYEAAPVGVITAVGAGIANGALLGMAGVYATQVGMSNARTAAFVAAAAVGSVLLQWPIGHMSDHMDRRRAILLVTLGAVAVGAIGIGMSPESVGIVGVMLLLGGLSFPIYSLALSHVVDVLPPGRAVTGSVAIVFLTGVGSIFGPLLASVAMTAVGPAGFFWTITVVHGAIGLFGLYRIVRRPVIEGIEPQPYVSVPARSTYIPRRIVDTAKKARRNGKASRV
ncbi:MAG: MFS transporter [Acidimicrobiia bacterium]